MRRPPIHSSSSGGILRLLTIAMLLLILYFGLQFKGAAIRNDISWIADQPGIRFNRSGIVYADNGMPRLPDALEKPLSIELAVKPANATNGHFRFLLLLHAGDDARQLVIGQWRSWLIVMNGNDYSAKRRQPRIAIEALHPGQTCFITIVSGNDGTSVFIDGKAAKRQSGLRLKIPVGEPQRLVLGNSIYGRHAWAGEIYGLAYYRRVLDAATVGNHFEQWRRDRSFAFARPARTAGLYLFDDADHHRVADHSGGGNHLQVPERMTILNKEYLSAPFAPEGSTASMLQDVVVNLLGFVPLGFLLSALLRGPRHRAFERRLGFVMIACGALSLGIELAQAWIPSRSSQMLDLILNTLGAGAGVLLHNAWQKVARPGAHRAPS